MLGQSISSKYSKEMEEFMWECKHCHQQFNFETTSEKGSHSRWCAENPKRAKYVEDLAHARNIQKEKKAYANQFTSTKEKRQKNSVIWPGNQFTTKRASGHSEETKEKLRQINTGRKHTPETIEKIRSHALGSKHQRVCKKTVEYICKNGDVVKIEHGNSGGIAIKDSGCVLGIPTFVQSGTVESIGRILDLDYLFSITLR